MRIVRLLPKEDPSSSSAMQFITCIETGVELTWNQASKLGWCADLEGEPFKAYYSPEGLKILKDREAVVNQLVGDFLQPALGK